MEAFDIDAMRARLAQARLEREQRLADLKANLGIEEKEEVTEAPSESDESSDVDLDAQSDGSESACGCSASLKLANPEVRWSGGGLVFVPKFDVRIKVRDERPEERWNLRLDYAGVSEFESGGSVAAPAKQGFGGSHVWGGSCVDTKLSFDGHAEPAVPLGQLVRSLFVEDAELEGTLTSRARLTGCDQEEKHQQFGIEVEEFGNLDIGRWGRVR